MYTTLPSPHGNKLIYADNWFKYNIRTLKMYTEEMRLYSVEKFDDGLYHWQGWFMVWAMNLCTGIVAGLLLQTRFWKEIKRQNGYQVTPHKSNFFSYLIVLQLLTDLRWEFSFDRVPELCTCIYWKTCGSLTEVIGQPHKLTDWSETSHQQPLIYVEVQ